MIRLSTATALGAMLAASPALAEITPATVWEQLSGYYETMGLSVKTDAVEEAGDTVTVRGLVLSQTQATPGAQPGTQIDMNLGDVVLTATGDGGVTMDLADQSTAKVTMEVPLPPEDPADTPLDPTVAPADEAATDATDAAGDAAQAAADAAADAAQAADAATDAADAATDAADAATDAAGAATDAADAAIDATAAETATTAEEVKTATVTVDLTMKNPGETITIREDGAANVYDYSFPTFEVNADRIVNIEGEVIENLGKLTFTNFTGTDRMEAGETFKLDQNGAAESVAINVNYADETGSAVIDGTIADVSYSGNAVVPPGTNMGAQLAAAMKAGLDLNGSFKAGQTDLKVDINSTDAEAGPQSVAATSTIASMSVDVLMSKGRVGYSGGYSGAKGEATISDLPFPVGYSADEAKFNIEAPVMAANDPQPFTFMYGFSGLTLSDGIWGMFDPQAILPRDPANVTVDLSGTARLDVDLLDPETMQDPNVVPGAFKTLKINKVEVSALGANVAATGDLTSPEAGDLTTPIGTINSRLTGINPLFDKLIQVGLMPEDQAMSMRMMLAMFAKPDAADANVLISDIEFKDGGSIFVNGQQVK